MNNNFDFNNKENKSENNINEIYESNEDENDLKNDNISNQNVRRSSRSKNKRKKKQIINIEEDNESEEKDEETKKIEKCIDYLTIETKLDTPFLMAFNQIGKSLIERTYENFQEWQEKFDSFVELSHSFGIQSLFFNLFVQVRNLHILGRKLAVAASSRWSTQSLRKVNSLLDSFLIQFYSQMGKEVDTDSLKEISSALRIFDESLSLEFGSFAIEAFIDLGRIQELTKVIKNQLKIVDDTLCALFSTNHCIKVLHHLIKPIEFNIHFYENPPLTSYSISSFSQPSNNFNTNNFNSNNENNNENNN